MRENFFFFSWTIKVGWISKILAGGKSGYIKEKEIPIINSHFPNSKIETLENTGHWLHAEKPTEFFNSVTQFLKE